MNSFAQNDSKIYGGARYLEKFFDEQLIKWLPFCIKRHSTVGNGEPSAPKKPRMNDETTVVIGEGDDDDVILA